MITKDISLEDCILDLVDNCLDGARKVQLAAGESFVKRYDGYFASVTLNQDGFEIFDNCGGIPIQDAIDYAFHFGRRPDAPSEGDYAIGLYGIGLKRAIFKLGRRIRIYSSTATEAFRSDIDVETWLKQTRAASDGALSDDWDFDMDDAPVDQRTGTRIDVRELYPEIARQFSNPEFANGLARIVGRDYAQFLAKGFQISVNERPVPGFQFSVRESDEFSPLRMQYEDESGVSVDIVAGMAGVPPDDLSPAEPRGETNNFGWFVLCNDRVVVSADKTNQTVWGDDRFPAWHYQYNGFVGVVSFHSKDPNLLPWKTTKRDVDRTNSVYRRAIIKMKEASRAWIDYTNERKSDLEEAKRRELRTQSIPLFEVTAQSKLRVPQIISKSTRVAMSTIQYQMPKSEIDKAKRMLGNALMPNYKVGVETFAYFMKNESEG